MSQSLQDSRQSGAHRAAEIATPRWPILWCLVLYLAATSRWGSYLSVPGGPAYIGDVALVAAAVQTVVLLRKRRCGITTVWSLLRGADVALHLCVVLLLWTLVRAIAGLTSLLVDPLVGLRDVAPYGYVATAVLAFVLPARNGARTRLLIYGVLTFHLAWILVGTDLPGWPWGLTLGGSTNIFTARPDVDSALAGIGIAFAAYDLLIGTRPRRLATVAGLVAFALGNGAVILSLQTRAGLLASVVGIGAVLAVWARRSTSALGVEVSPRRRAVVVALALVVLGVVVILSPPGHRLVQALRGEQGQALGTVQVRESAWAGVIEYITADPSRTAVGVGFGPDFVQASGRAYLLEGTEYADVRSPHNYLIGTFARLGLAGALIALLAIAFAVVLAVRTLGDADPPTAFAAVLVLTLPTTAFLGVVLEAPFGAIPFFWAVGQLAAHSREDSASTSQ